jgi:uncharacterized protein YuzE
MFIEKIEGKKLVEMDISDDLLLEMIKVTPYILKFPVKKMLFDYDKQADVLYIGFKRPQKVTDTEMKENGVLFRYENDEIVGITVLDASKR